MDLSTNRIYGRGSLLTASTRHQDQDQTRNIIVTGTGTGTGVEAKIEHKHKPDDVTHGNISNSTMTSDTTDETERKKSAAARCDNRHYNFIPKKRKLSDLQEFYRCSDANKGSTYKLENRNRDSRNRHNFEASAVPKADLKSNDISPQEAAFAIDHILESILSHLPNRNLPKIRLVSHRFNYISSKLLRNYLKLFLTIPGDFISVNHSDEISFSTTLGLQKSMKSLEELNTVLKNSNSQFPCTSFILMTENLKEPRLQNLLDIYGSNLKTLDLNVFYTESTIKELTILTELQSLLMEQVPNLVCLVINISAPMLLPIPSSSPAAAALVSNSNQNSIESTMGAWTNNKFTLPNLKSLSIKECTSGIFERLMNAAVNLETYDGHEEEFLNYFINSPGLGRLHLLKNVSICITPTTNLIRLDAIARLIERNETLRIQTLYLSCMWIVESCHLWPQVLSVINRILKGASRTVEALYWESVKFLRGIKFPVMSKVETLFLAGASSEVLKHVADAEKGFFPIGFDFPTVFPVLKRIFILSQDKLSGISLSSLLDLDNHHSSSSSSLDTNSNNNLKTVQSVTSVKFNNSAVVSVEERNLFRRVFPNAVVTSESESDSEPE